ncbi:MAG: tRNA dihydrouridine synthase DusB [Bacilli bacterium]|nr:tRNA dihydrouridine synthase DusB [Bacilli bacterium]
MKFKIRDIELANQVCLAPMAGISNPSYIKICEEMGLGYAVTELISAEAIVRNNKKTFDMLNRIDTLNIPVAIQLFGSNVETLAKASKIIADLHKNVFIDINMGCPVPKVAVRSQAGASLLKNPDKVYEIVSNVVKAVPCPVTVKIRSGWDNDSINAVEVAKICEKAGASAITVHPRTRAQGYAGHADWAIIKDVKDNVRIPVIGNGDIKTPLDAKRMLDETGCDAVMIGRASLGNPWLIKDTVDYLEKNVLNAKPAPKEKIMMCLKHLNYLLGIKPEKQALLEIRSHISWYLKGINGGANIKTLIFGAKTKEQIIEILSRYLQDL